MDPAFCGIGDSRSTAMELPNRKICSIGIKWEKL
jgi:hypothetical protein